MSARFHRVEKRTTTSRGCEAQLFLLKYRINLGWRAECRDVHNYDLRRPRRRFSDISFTFRQDTGCKYEQVCKVPASGDYAITGFRAASCNICCEDVGVRREGVMNSSDGGDDICTYSCPADPEAPVGD